MTEVVCIGLDLAWSSRNRSGGAVIVGGRLCEAIAELTDDQTIVQWVGSWLRAGDAAIVAVDAPLCVPNWEGKRACELQLGHDWAYAHAGPYPSNRRRFDNDVRGERIVRALGESFGFVESVDLSAQTGGRMICEVYPHPAHVNLFKRSTILKYKKKGKRSYEACWAGLEEYQQLLRGLSTYDPPLLDPHGLLDECFEGIRGKSLKALEDRLDAVTCAYVASYLQRHGLAGTHVYGSVEEGHILVPRSLPTVGYSASGLT